jgi:hypothetical protein
MYSSYSLTISALDGCEGKGSPVPIAQEAGWASELVWTQRLEEKSFASAGDGSSDTILTELARLRSFLAN